MKTKPVLLILLAGLVLASDATARVFVATNSTWRYFKGTSEASTPTNAWRELAFDDSAWLTGAAPFHYGINAVGGDDNLTNGTILSDMRSNYTCVFLRQTFVIDDTNSLRGLWLNVWFDDGLGIWINGQPPRGPIYLGGLAYTDTANNSREGTVLNRIDISSAIATLRSGTNVLCLQAVNQSLTGDDFRIDAELAETPPSLAFASATATVHENDRQVILRVVSTGGIDAGVTVDYATTNGTALAGQDYVATNGSLTFAQGQTEQTIAVPILNDALPESTENFQIKLSNPGGGPNLGAPASVTVSITDSDKGLHFYVPAVSVNEDAGEIKIKVARGDDGDMPVSVDYATANGTAVAGQDYSSTAGTIVFAPGEVLKSFTVPVLNDALAEPAKSFQATLSNPTGGAVLSTPALVAVTITNTDQVIQFDSASYQAREEAEFVQIGVARGESGSAATVDFTTSDGTAKAGLDYTGVTSTIQFAAGERSKRIAVPILNDPLKETSESFQIRLSNPTGGAILGSPAAATVTIADNDPGVGFTRSVFSVWTNVAVAQIDVLRGREDLLSSFTVDYQTVNGSAQAGVDYQATSGTLHFEANQTLQAITIPLLQNPAATGTRYFTVTLGNVSGGIPLGVATTRVNILHPRGYFPIVPWSDAKPRFWRENSVNLVSWEGDGVLQRADQVTGPWEDLGQVSSPYAIRPSLPRGFYRIQHSPRPTEVYVPPRYDGRTPLPLILALHGAGQSSAEFRTGINLEPLAESRGFLVCYPDGTVNTAGYRFWTAADFSIFYGPPADDSGYLRGVIEEIQRRFAVDPKRIYLTGYSSGGAMSHRLAGEHADLIAGIASMAGMTSYDPNAWRPTHPVNVLQIHGTADTDSLYQGGFFTDGLPVLAEFPGAVRSVQIWADCNGCQNPVFDSAPSLDLTTQVGEIDTTVMRYTQCPPGGSVELWTVNGGNHYLFWNQLAPQFLPLLVDWLLAHPKP